MSTGTESPNSLNTQNFSDSDDEILDGFAEGPLPGDPPRPGDTHDDGTPMGLGGEKGKQSEPASSTLEADIASDTKPGKELPEDAATSEPVADDGEEIDEKVPSIDSDEPEAPEFSSVLLQMAGYADAEAAKADGFGTPEALHAFIRGRGQLLTPEREGPLYGRKETPAPAEQSEELEVKPFELPADKVELLDEDLVDLLKQMNEHYQNEIQSLRKSSSTQRQEVDEVTQFDQAVQSLGEQWQDTFGEGPGEELADKARHNASALAAFRNRDELFDVVQDLRARNAKKGLAPMTVAQEVYYALQERHPEKFQQIVFGKEKPKSRSTNRPTQRNTPPRTQNDKTLAAVNRMLAKKGRSRLTADPSDGFDGEI